MIVLIKLLLDGSLMFTWRRCTTIHIDQRHFLDFSLYTHTSTSPIIYPTRHEFFQYYQNYVKTAQIPCCLIPLLHTRDIALLTFVRGPHALCQKRARKTQPVSCVLSSYNIPLTKYNLLYTRSLPHPAFLHYTSPPPFHFLYVL